MFVRHSVGDGEKRKLMTTIDITAEVQFRDALLSKFRDIKVLGEESFVASPADDFVNTSQTCVLLDMIDGTDLLKRDFSNWCSAVAIFDPSRRQIEGAYVGLADRWLYYANDQGAYKIPLTATGHAVPARQMPATRLTAPTTVRKLRDAAICMYGQKSGGFLRLLELSESKPKFYHWLKERAAEDAELKTLGQAEVPFRFYNLAGNPMMVRVCDGAVDVVVELGGQLPHDVVAGAYIAIKAGAVIGSPDTYHIYTTEDLLNASLNPATKRLRYILASSEILYKDVLDILS
jgi:fructose-1,6-bisphosphatase/inositol monophosphatase family enzyme